MFGLMRAKTCRMSAEEKNFRRLNYCGTCKTTGALYGAKSRLLLNHDAVFLAEILTALSKDIIDDWQKSYQSYNCLSLPKDEMPVSLQFAATANVILTAFKLADHVSDEGKRRFLFAQRAFSKEFTKAERLLQTWNFPLDKVKKILETQSEREMKSLSLEDLAEPTALATAEFFAHGAVLIGKGESKSQAYEIGLAFGKLIYILDAFEDYERDFRRNQFNALRRVFRLTENNLSAEAKRRITVILLELESEIISKIYELPIAENQKRLFASRLESNLRRKLKTELPVLQTKKICHPPLKQTWSQKRETASRTARRLARNYSWQMPLVFLFVFAFALAAPAAQTKEAKSVRECFDLSLNLMFLGAIFSSVVTFPKTIRMKSPDEEKEQRKADAVEGGCECCCDGCCCGCESCDGCCDNCDCCGGCCDNCDCGSSCD